MAFQLWLEFEHWVTEQHDDPCDDFFNAMITLEDGSEYALNVWTFKFVERARRGCADDGECLDGDYLLPPDLLVERLDRTLMENVVADLMKNDALRPDWRVEDE